jgi:hypothetical protein
MTAFTILGVIVFWLWCFHAGVLLGWASDLGSLVFRIWTTERKLRKDLDSLVALATKQGEPA